MPHWPRLTRDERLVLLIMGRVNQLEPVQTREAARPPPRKRARRWRIFAIIVVVLVAVVGTARAMLPGFVRDYVNRTLDRNPLYAGEIGSVDIHLLRGAYAIDNVRISKTTGNVPVPFFAAKRVDFA